MTRAVRLTRVASGSKGTFGVLTEDNIPLCVTLEDPWHDNARLISCIPPGTYRCRKHSGPRFHDVWEVTAVPGRDAILIHQGNTTTDTSGCVLVGRTFTTFGDKPGIGSSRDALDYLRVVLPPEFRLEVVGPPA